MLSSSMANLSDGVEMIHRPARTTSPAAVGETLFVQRPPEVDDDGGGGMGFLGLIPLLGAAGSMTVMMLFRGSPFAAVGALMMIVTVTGAIVMLFSQRGKAGRRRRELRDNYLEYLERRREEFLQEERVHRADARTCNPLPQALFDVIADPHRLWERRRHHEDFLNVRLGTGSVHARTLQLEGEAPQGKGADPHMESELQSLVGRFTWAPDMPVLVDLRKHHTISIVGDEEFGHQVVRNLLLSAVTLHSPEDLYVAAALPRSHKEQWRWLSMLPHVLDQSRPTAQGPLNRIAPSMTGLQDYLDDEIRTRYKRFAEVRKNFLADAPALAQPRLLVFDMEHSGEVENLQMPDASLDSDDLSITVLHMISRQVEEPEEVSLRISQTPSGFKMEDYLKDPLRPETGQGAVTDVDRATAEGVARMLSPLRLSPDSLEHDDEVNSQRFTAHLGVQDFSGKDLERLWKPRELPDLLRVPIGVNDRGRPVNLDIKESAQHGMGPHGLCVGATGSGKSELLRTLVMGLAVTHPPDILNMVLVDYKGGATFAPFGGIPHVSGIVTNLSDDASLVDRIYSSLEGEVLRRQEALKKAGNIANITDYQLHRAERADDGEDLPPLPHLFVVIDEFGELLTAQPDFIDLFMSIGRIGRSIGVHLLLSSQRIEAGKLRGLETHLSYRLGLRTLSEGESRTVLETPDAFHLPPLPGFGYLKVDTTTYSRFKAGYVSGPLQTETRSEEEEQEDQTLPVLVNSFYAEDAAEEVVAERDDAAEAEGGIKAPERSTGPTVMSTLVDVMRERERVTDPIWLPPLPDLLTLDRAYEMDGLGAVPVSSERRSRQLTAPIGLLDDPARQWQGLWNVDLTRAGGNVAILGGPSSGKTTALRTIALSLAATHSVEEVALFGIDLKGSAMLPLSELPHSAGMAGRTSREALRRTVEEVSDILDEREKFFEDKGIDSLGTMRRLHAEGKLPELSVADIVLLVDGWGSLLDEFEGLQDQVYGILSRGGGYGIHVVATATRWNEVRIAQQSFFGTRLELRLGEPAESTHGRKVAEKLPADRPGRGLNSEALIGQIAVPRIDGEADVSTLSSGLRHAVDALTAAVPEKTPRRVKMLPTLVEPGELAAAETPGVIPFGIVERTMSPKYLDINGQERHLMLMGDELSGKSSLLRHIMLTLADQHTTDEIVFAVYDPRRSLQGVLHEDYLGGYATSTVLAQKLTTAVSQELQSRVPDDPLASTRPGTFKGPRIVLIVDDYDVLTAGGNSPLRGFTEYLAMGAEIGLHAFVARRVRGASRGLFEPFAAALREAGGGTFMMDGDKAEGALVNNVRPRKQPPGRGLYLHGGKSPATIQTIFREGSHDSDT